MQCRGKCGRDLPEFMLNRDGICAQCVSKLKDVEAANKRKRTPKRADTRSVEATDQLNDVVEDRRQRREATRRQREEEVARISQHEQEVRDRYAETQENPNTELFEARYADEVEATTARQQERREENRKRALEARQEMARRQLANRRLLPYVRLTTPQYDAGWFHKDLARELEMFFAAVERGESPRLMVSVPPRHGKTELVSIKFPSWALGKRPDFEFITASYSSDLANKISRSVLSTVRGDAHKRVFPDFRLDPNAQSVTEWMTAQAGAFFPTGVGGPATGRGAHILLIDDPVKNREEAESESTRQTIKDWYTSTAYTRLAPGGGVILVQTRWHDDDLSGWLLEQDEKDAGDHWRKVVYPAVATHDEKYRRKGEALHPERFPLSALQRIKKAIGPRDWNALYQQNPVPDSGDYFKKEDFIQCSWEEVPPIDELAIYAAWDFAIGEKQQNDFTVGIVVGFDRHDHLWILDEYRGQWGSLKIIDRMFMSYRKWHPVMTGGEHGHISMTLAPFIQTKKAEENLFGFHIEPLRVGRMDKVARARAFQGLAESGRVHIPMDRPWSEGLLHELLRFPNGRNDDRVDALAHIGMMQEKFQPKPDTAPPKKKSWRDNLHKYVGQGGPSGSAMSA